MTYIDGYVLPVPAKNLDAYKKLAKKAAKLWVEHGALDYKECVEDDMEDKGFCKTFIKTIKPKKGEVVIFAFITFKSRNHRDKVNKNVLNDPGIKEMCDEKNMPFDCKRMTWGGFKTIVESSHK